MTSQQIASTGGFSDALRRLSQAQKSSVGAPLYSRFINRPLGRVLAATAYVVGLRPNHVTVISALFTFAALVTLAIQRPSAWVGVAVAVGLVCGYALDAADGQLARLRGGGSKAGEFLDHVVDCAKTTSLHLVILIAWYRFGDPTQTSLLIVPVVYCVQASLWFFAIILIEQMARTAVQGKPGAVASVKKSRLQSLIMLPADYGFLIIIFLLWGWQAAFVPVYVTMAIVNVALLVVALVRWYRRAVALDSPRVSERT